MSSRQNVLVPQEEISRQNEFIRVIKEANAGALKKYAITTYGCQMNENDSERLAGFLSGMGYTASESEGDADLIIYNTCCVRENAELKVYGHLGALKNLKKRKRGMIIAVCGCMMQQREVVEHIEKKYPHVDIIFGTHNLYRFPELLYGVRAGGGRIVEVQETEGAIAEGLPMERKDGVKAWVTIMYGCNNFCSYCIVPYVRGRERSRRPGDIAEEVRALVKEGYREITLLGQNVNSYGMDSADGLSFAGLLHEINKIEGIYRIRFMTSHPKDLSDSLIEAIRDCEKVCGHLHLPVQSGSSRLLKEMNRKYTREHYLGLGDKLREAVPGISITTDIIVGYPGETEEDFLETLDLIERVRFDFAFTFLYSKRSGTPAARSPEQVPEEIKKRRFDRLVGVQNKISREINEGLLGKSLEVLVEGRSKNSGSTYTGRTGSNKVVNFKGSEELIGKLVSIRIEKVRTWSLVGSVTDTV